MCDTRNDFEQNPEVRKKIVITRKPKGLDVNPSSLFVYSAWVDEPKLKTVPNSELVSERKAKL